MQEYETMYRLFPFIIADYLIKVSLLNFVDLHLHVVLKCREITGQ